MITYGEIVLTIIAVLLGTLIVYLHGMNEKISNLLTVIEKSFAETKGMLERMFDKISSDKHTAIDPEFKLKHLDITVNIEIADLSEKFTIMRIEFTSRELVGEEGLQYAKEKINADYPDYIIAYNHALDIVNLIIRPKFHKAKIELSPSICAAITKDFLNYFDEFYKKRKEWEENFEKEF